MIKIDLKAIDAVVGKYVAEFYTKQKPIQPATSNNPMVSWFREPLRGLLSKHRIAQELKHMATLRIAPKASTETCIKKPLKLKGVVDYGGYDSKTYILSQSEVVRVTPIEFTGDDPYALQKKVEQMIDLSKRAGEIGIGPKIHDAYICYSDKETYIAIRMEYVKGEILQTLIDREGGLSELEKTAIWDLIRDKYETLHKNNITMGFALNYKSIVVIYKNKTPVDVRFVSFADGTDLEKSSQEAIDRDNHALHWMKSKLNNYVTNVSNFEDYVICRMMDDKKLVVTGA